MERIRVIVKRPDEKYGHVTNISNSLRNLQNTVEGYIETVTFPDFVIICNEEGRIKGLPHNANIRGVDFCGDIIVCGADGENFGDVGISLQKWKEIIDESEDN